MFSSFFVFKTYFEKRGHVHLKNGDILTMEGLFQKYYQHRVPRQGKCTEPRINFTWRYIVNHSEADGCKL